MMLGRSGVRGIRRLGDGCLKFSLSDLQTAFGGNPTTVNMYQLMGDSGGEGGCIPSSYWPLIPSDYMDSHLSMPQQAPTADYSAKGYVAPPVIIAPPPPAPVQQMMAPSPVITVGQNNAPVPTQQLVAPLAPSIPMAPLISNSNTQTLAAPVVAPSTSSSGIPSTIFGINSTYVLIGGAVLAFMVLGGKK